MQWFKMKLANNKAHMRPQKAYSKIFKQYNKF